MNHQQKYNTLLALVICVAFLVTSFTSAASTYDRTMNTQSTVRTNELSLTNTQSLNPSQNPLIEVPSSYGDNAGNIFSPVLGRTPDEQVHSYKPGEFIIKIKGDYSIVLSYSSDGFVQMGIPSIDKLNSDFGVKKIEKLFVGNTAAKDSELSKVYTLTISPDADIMKIVSSYSKDNAIEYAEPNYMYQACVIPNDPSFSQQWGLNQPNDHDIDAPEAWDIETGNSNTIVAIVDTGIDYTHPDLTGNIWTNSHEIPGNGIDDDGNGFIDDVRGWDFINNDNDPIDDFGHGTHCAGIVSAVTDNSVGIASIGWNCKIMALKGLDNNGNGYDTSLANAITYAVDNGANVISMSWGSSQSSQAIATALSYANSHGVVLVAAAGNSNARTRFYPAATSYVISVAATDSNDMKASFSNYGSWIDVAAPGAGIFSTMPTYHVTMNDQGYGMNYDYMSGTSMACPQVAGLIGLIKSRTPGLSPLEVKTILRSTVDSISANTFYVGVGRINAFSSIQIDTTPIADLNPLLDDRTVLDTITIRGKAYGTTFSDYHLYLGVGVYPSEWTEIFESTVPITNGVMTTLDTTLYPDGVYSIRLLVHDINGGIREDRQVVTFNNVYINYPIDNSHIKNTISIWGRAPGTSFIQYTLAYGEGSSPVDWTILIVSTTPPVVCQELTTLDTCLLHDGVYSIRLAAEYGFGISEDRIIVIVDNVNLSSPFDNDIYRAGDLLEIKGSANGPTDERFAVQWGLSRDGDPTEWFTTGMNLINDGHMGIIDDTLASWDTSFIVTGDYYTLRLVVLDSNGAVLSVEAFIKLLYLDPTLKAGWPQRIPFHGFVTGPMEPVVSDIDNDGLGEIIVYQAGAHLFVYRQDGSLDWEVIVGNADLYMDNMHIPLVGDINNDGFNEIIVYNSGLYCYDHTGSILWQNTDLNDEYHPTFLMADVNHDGAQEIIMKGNYAAFLGEQMTIIRGIDGTILAQWPIPMPDPNWNGYPVVSNPAIGNFDGDSDYEIVCAGPYVNANPDNPVGFITVYNIDGSVVPGWPVFTNGVIWSSPAVGDINNDGALEIVVGVVSGNGGVYAFDAHGNILPGWPFGTGIGFISSPALADFDQNGDLEIVISGFSGGWPNYIAQTFVLHHNGQLASGWPQSTSWPAWYSPVIGDVNNDGCADIIETAGDGFCFYRGGVNAWTYTGTWIPEFPKVTENLALAPAAIADIDHDGHVEVIASSNDDYNYNTNHFKDRSSIYVWEFPSVFRPSTMYWPTFHHDNQHTGLLPPPVPIFVDDNYNINTPGWGIDHFNTIQTGINAAMAYARIHVNNGVYHETIAIDKPVYLLGENREQTIVDGNARDNVIKISANNVHISGFTIQNGGMAQTSAGLLVQSNTNVISGNIFKSSGCGVYLQESRTQNIISGNIISEHYYAGIFLGRGSSQNTITQNTITSTSMGCYGIDLSTSIRNTISGNTVSSYLEGVHLSESSDANIISENTFTSDGMGLGSYHSQNNLIKNNNFFSYVFSWLASETDGLNQWSANYWDDYLSHYPGHDENHDDCWDTPYVIPGGQLNADPLPLITPYGIPIHVLTPNGGEVWSPMPPTHTILWGSSDGFDGQHVRISIQYKPNSNWITIAENIPNHKGLNHYDWVWMPPYHQESTHCRIKVEITSIPTPGNQHLFDISDHDFTITTGAHASLRMVSPNGGELWHPGLTQEIVWESVGKDIVNPSSSPVSQNNEKILLSISYDSGKTWNDIASIANSEGMNTYRWAIPKNIPTSSTCLFKVTLANSGDDLVFDTSDGDFIIK